MDRLTLTEAARVAGVHESTIRRKVADGSLQKVEGTGRRVFVTIEALRKAGFEVAGPGERALSAHEAAAQIEAMTGLFAEVQARAEAAEVARAEVEARVAQIEAEVEARVAEVESEARDQIARVEAARIEAESEAREWKARAEERERAFQVLEGALSSLQKALEGPQKAPERPVLEVRAGSRFARFRRTKAQK